MYVWMFWLFIFNEIFTFSLLFWIVVDNFERFVADYNDDDGDIDYNDNYDDDNDNEDTVTFVVLFNCTAIFY